MLKQGLLFILLSFIVLLSGCDAEKTFTVKNVLPEELFLQTFIIFTHELPSTKLDINIASKNISYDDSSITQYPSNLTISFIKDSHNTNIVLVAKDTNETKLNNLNVLLQNAYDTYLVNKQSSQMNAEENEEEAPPQMRRIDLIQ